MRCANSHQGRRCRWRWFRVQVLLVASLVFCGGLNGRAQDALRTEYEVKAEFLPLFAQFVKWPAESFTDTNSPLVVGVLGNDPFGEALDRAVGKQKTAGGRKLVIKRSRDVADVKTCHLLFISRSEKDNIEPVLAAVAQTGRPVLTVADTEGFALRGGIINFVLQGRKVRFEINRETACRRGLTISWELLNLANAVAATGKGSSPETNKKE